MEVSGVGQREEKLERRLLGAGLHQRVGVVVVDRLRSLLRQGRHIGPLQPVDRSGVVSPHVVPLSESTLSIGQEGAVGVLLDEVEELEVRLLSTHTAAGNGIEVKCLLAHNGHTPGLLI